MFEKMIQMIVVFSLKIDSTFFAHPDTLKAFLVALCTIGTQVVAAFGSRFGSIAEPAESTHLFAAEASTEIDFGLTQVLVAY